MLSKKHWRSSTVQEEGLENEGKHHLLLLHKQAHDKRGIAESLHVVIYNSQKYSPPPLIVEPLKLIAHGHHILGRVQYLRPYLAEVSLEVHT